MCLQVLAASCLIAKNAKMIHIANLAPVVTSLIQLKCAAMIVQSMVRTAWFAQRRNVFVHPAKAGTVKREIALLTTPLAPKKMAPFAIIAERDTI